MSPRTVAHRTECVNPWRQKSEGTSEGPLARFSRYGRAPWPQPRKVPLIGGSPGSRTPTCGIKSPLPRRSANDPSRNLESNQGFARTKGVCYH